MWSRSMLEPGRVAAIRADAATDYREYVRQGIRAGCLHPATRMRFGPGRRRERDMLRNLAIRDAIDRLYRGSFAQAYSDLSALCEAEGWRMTADTLKKADRKARGLA